MKKKKASVQERIKWCYSFNTSKRWLTTVKVEGISSEYTEKEYATGLYDYCQWLSKTPDQLIAERKKELKNPETEWNAEDKLREFCLMLEEKKKLRKSTIVTKYHSSVVSFYKHNHVPLRLSLPKYAMRERRPHTVEELKTLMKVGDLRERTIMMILKDSGMSREDVITLKYEDVKNELENGKDFIHLRVVRQKEAIEYDTFLGKNAIEHLKAYLELRKRLGEKITEKSPLLATKQGKPLKPATLSMIFDRMSNKKVNFKTSPHRFRKFFESHMGLTAPSMLVRYWIGHSLGVEKSYFIPPVEKQREKYIEAYKEIDVLKVEPKISREEVRKEVAETLPDDVLKPIAEKLGLSIDQVRLQMAHGVLEEPKEEPLEQYPPIREKLDSVKLKKKYAPKEEDCQKIVSEKELEKWLSKGWHVEAVLPSGKIVVSND